MQKSGFYPALNSGGEWDRTYTANDYTENLAVVIGTGVLRSENDDLKPTGNGMNVTIAPGRAWINGRWYKNDSAVTFTVPTAPSGGGRIDRIVLRANSRIESRQTTLEYLTGTSSNSPTPPVYKRFDDEYDLVLCNIYISAGATGATVVDTRSDRQLCGWVYSVRGDESFFESLDASFLEWFNGAKDTLSSVTLFKRYNWSSTLSAAAQSVAFNIPQYDPDTCFIEVYVNGILDSRYTLNNNVITFAGTLVAGTVVVVKCYKSIDGTGIMSVADEITALQNQYATLSGISNFTYKCTGVNDNIALSEIAQAFYNGSYIAANVSAPAAAFLSAIGGNTFLAGLEADAQITINVSGKIGITSPAGGSGTTASRYRWFNIGIAGAGEKRVIFDFAKCDKIKVTCTNNTENIIFYGTDLFIKNANVYASGGVGCAITMIVGSNNRGTMEFDNCRFKVVTSGNATIAHNGTFTNCTLHVKSSAGNAYCIDAKSESLVRLFGGSYYAYTAQASMISACLNVNAGETDAAIMAQNINCPIVAQTGYTQYYTARTYAGMTFIDGIITTNNYAGSADYRNITGKITKNKR